MGRFAEKYTESQRREVVRAIVDKGVGPTRARELLAAGELDCPAVEMPLNYLKQLAHKERAKRNRETARLVDQHGRPEAIRILTNRAIGVLEREIERVELRQSRSQKLETRDLDRILRWLREIDRVDAPRDKSAGAAKGDVPDQPAKREPEMTAEMKAVLAAHREQTRGSGLPTTADTHTYTDTDTAGDAHPHPGHTGQHEHANTDHHEHPHHHEHTSDGRSDGRERLAAELGLDHISDH